ncbi:hypothetical protein [Argonema antarcticum]|uniref:hypothetical protein n=1 Tax=Argonema antarcticum TaxID=2942763 RepID=UPI00201344AC|nr:hypothetical protein [Argonema antarcticum]MCL1470473.1 hypothetical protein [Argonema antarcticum A004/B2]
MSVVSGQWSVVSCQLLVVSGQLSVVISNWRLGNWELGTGDSLPHSPTLPLPHSLLYF